MGKKIVVALDGPAGAGKSTVAKIVAKRLNIEYLDSGAFYRAITKKLLDSNAKIDDYREVENLIQDMNLEYKDNRIYINDEDLTDFIRTKEVSLVVSPVSSIIAVRKKVNEYLNRYSNNKSIIMDGRDIGTVVFPKADYKFYLDASIDIRAKRRFDEKKLDLSLEEIKTEIKKRDDNDKSKPFGALKVADDAIFIDTTEFTIDEVVEKIISYIK